MNNGKCNFFPSCLGKEQPNMSLLHIIFFQGKEYIVIPIHIFAMSNQKGKHPITSV